jgi:PDZ domain
MSTNKVRGIGLNRPGQWALIAGGAAILAGSALPTLAQPQHRFDKPIHEKQPAGEWQGGGQAHIEMSQSNNNDTYSVKIKNDQISAQHNGQPIPPDRIRKKNGVVELLGKDGDVVATFHIGAAGANVRAVPGDDENAVALLLNAEKPKVMLGVTMADVAESLLDHLKLEPNTAIQLDRVVEGLPADKAGLKVKDIIIELDGTRPITQEKFREILKEKNPGETVEVKVLRKGDTKSFTIKLEAWDGAKLGVTPGGAFAWGDNEQTKQWAQEAMKNAEKMREHWGDMNSPEWRQHLDTLKKFQGEDGKTWLFNLTPDQMQMFTPMDPEGSKRVEERLKKVESRLDKLADRLEKLADLLEKQQGKSGR